MPSRAADADLEHRLDALKDQACAAVDGLRPTLVGLSRRIHANPELQFEERRAAAWLSEALEAPPAPGPRRRPRSPSWPSTARSAGWGTSPAGCSSSAPPPRRGGGKIPFVEAGFFNDVTAAISMHPMGNGRPHTVGGRCLAVQEPGIVRRGGEAPNVVPEYAEGEFLVRAADRDTLAATVAKVKDCARAGALAAGARLEIQEGTAYRDVRPDPVLGEVALENLRRLGVEVGPAPAEVGPARACRRTGTPLPRRRRPRRAA